MIFLNVGILICHIFSAFALLHDQSVSLIAAVSSFLFFRQRFSAEVLHQRYFMWFLTKAFWKGEVHSSVQRSALSFARNCVWLLHCINKASMHAHTNECMRSCEHTHIHKQTACDFHAALRGHTNVSKYIYNRCCILFFMIKTHFRKFTS